MKIPNADFLDRTGSTAMGARLWRMPPMSANTLHKHVSSEEFYFVLEGKGRIRIADETLTIQKHGGIHVMPEQLRQVFNDSEEEEVLWLVFGAPDVDTLPAQGGNPDDFYPVDPQQLPFQLNGVKWPPPQFS